MNTLDNMATPNVSLKPQTQRLQKAGLAIFACGFMLSYTTMTSAADTQGTA